MANASSIAPEPVTMAMAAAGSRSAMTTSSRPDFAGVNPSSWRAHAMAASGAAKEAASASSIPVLRAPAQNRAMSSARAGAAAAATMRTSNARAVSSLPASTAWSPSGRWRSRMIAPRARRRTASGMRNAIVCIAAMKAQLGPQSVAAPTRAVAGERAATTMRPSSPATASSSPRVSVRAAGASSRRRGRHAETRMASGMASAAASKATAALVATGAAKSADR